MSWCCIDAAVCNLVYLHSGHSNKCFTRSSFIHSFLCPALSIKGGGAGIHHTHHQSKASIPAKMCSVGNIEHRGRHAPQCLAATPATSEAAPRHHGSAAAGFAGVRGCSTVLHAPFLPKTASRRRRVSQQRPRP